MSAPNGLWLGKTVGLEVALLETGSAFEDPALFQRRMLEDSGEYSTKEVFACTSLLSPPWSSTATSQHELVIPYAGDGGKLLESQQWLQPIVCDLTFRLYESAENFIPALLASHGSLSSTAQT